jgi:hypothetical protein
MNKTVIAIIIILAIAGGVYFYMNGNPVSSSTSSLLETKTNPVVQESATRILSLLKQINALQIKTEIFKSADFQTLRDYSVDIPEQDVGRSNPFAPLPGDIIKVQTNNTNRR